MVVAGGVGLIAAATMSATAQDINVNGDRRHYCR